MEEELGWSRPSLLMALSLGLLTAGAVAPWVGARIDREGGRKLMSFGSLLSAILLLFWAQTSSLQAFYAIWLGLGIAQGFTLYEPAFAVLNRELSKDAGRAVVLVTLVAGFASTVFIPLSHTLVASWGWRSALYGLSALHLLVCLPLHLTLPSRQVDTSTSRKKAIPAHIFQQRSFWGLLISCVANGAVFSIVSFHGLPLFMESGVSESAAVGLMALIGPSQVLARLGLISRKGAFSPSKVGRITCLVLPLGILGLIFLPQPLAAGSVFIMAYGVSAGIATILRGTAAAELLGQESFGAINGILATPAAIALAISPSLAAYLWLKGGSYELVNWSLLAIAVVGAAGFWTATAAGASTPKSVASGISAIPAEHTEPL